MRKKLQKFEENRTAKNVLEPGKPLYDSIKGNWSSYFKNSQPITLEVGAGRGEYTTGLARRFPHRNFIGLDIKGDRLWHGSTTAKSEHLTNVAFLRARAEQLLDFFNPHEIAEIWITFPGPRPKNTEARLRLTNPRFLELYKQILKPGGAVHVKTDSDLVYSYTLEQIKKRGDIELLEKTADLYETNLLQGHHGIQTHFERKFLAQKKPIKYIKFRFKAQGDGFLTKRRLSSIIRALFALFPRRK